MLLKVSTKYASFYLSLPFDSENVIRCSAFNFVKPSFVQAYKRRVFEKIQSR